MFIYIAILGLATGGRWALPVAAAFALLSLVLPPAIKPWHAGLDTWTAASLGLVSLAMWAFFGIIHTNHELEEARAEVAVLAAEGERNRIARDLHDLLGHSLTTITVKAGLAKRLADHDPRARCDRDRRGRGARSPGAHRRARRQCRITESSRWPASSRPAQEVLRATGIDAHVLQPDRGCRHRPPGALRMGGARGNHQRRAPFARDHVHDHARAPFDRDHRRRRRRRELARQRDATGASSGTGLKGLRERLGSVGGTLEVGVAVGGGWRIVAGGAVTIRLLVGRRSGPHPFGARRVALDSTTTSRSSPKSAVATRSSPPCVEHGPDVALLDIEMPGLDGLAAAAAICRAAARVPGARPHDVRPHRATCAARWRPARSVSS